MLKSLMPKWSEKKSKRSNMRRLGFQQLEHRLTLSTTGGLEDLVGATTDNSTQGGFVFIGNSGLQTTSSQLSFDSLSDQVRLMQTYGDFAFQGMNANVAGWRFASAAASLQVLKRIPPPELPLQDPTGGWVANPVNQPDRPLPNRNTHENFLDRSTSQAVEKFGPESKPPIWSPRLDNQQLDRLPLAPSRGREISFRVETIAPPHTISPPLSLFPSQAIDDLSTELPELAYQPKDATEVRAFAPRHVAEEIAQQGRGYNLKTSVSTESDAEVPLFSQEILSAALIELTPQLLSKDVDLLEPSEVSNSNEETHIHTTARHDIFADWKRREFAIIPIFLGMATGVALARQKNGSKRNVVQTPPQEHS